MRNHAAVEFALKPSLTLAAVIIGLHAAAAGSILVVALPSAVKMVLCAVLVISAILSVRRHALLIASESCIAVRVGQDGVCELRLRSGETDHGNLTDGWFEEPNLVVLNWRSDAGHHRRSVVLLPDSADREALRQLRVFLRFKLPSKSMRQQHRIGRLR
ncbi:MAG: protein YgfX [Burkholderiales bacterium]